MPSPDELLDLLTRIEAQGGEHIDEACKGKTYTFSSFPAARPKAEPAFLKGCGNNTIVELPEGGTVCVLCDGVLEWPRYMP